MTERTEDYYREKLRAAGVPEHMHDGYVLYLLHGILPGSFGEAVLSNDLREACSRADYTNQRALYQHVAFLYNYAPSGCWGSPEKVALWVALRRDEAAQGRSAVDPSVAQQESCPRAYDS